MYVLKLEERHLKAVPTFLEYYQRVNADRKESLLIAAAVEDDLVRGLCIYSNDTVVHIQVDKDCRRSGIGSRLLEWSLSPITVKECAAYVDPENTASMCFFSQQNFVAKGWCTMMNGERRLKMVRGQNTFSETEQCYSSSNDFIVNFPIFISAEGRLKR